MGFHTPICAYRHNFWDQSATYIEKIKESS